MSTKQHENDIWGNIDADNPILGANEDYELAPIDVLDNGFAADSFSIYAEAELSSVIHDVLNSLPTKENLVLRMYFGIPNGETHTLKEIAETIGISHQQATDVKNRAIRMLKHPSRSHRTRSLIDDSTALSLPPSTLHTMQEDHMAAYRQRETPQEKATRKNARLSRHVVMGAAWIKAGEKIEKGKRIARNIASNPLLNPDHCERGRGFSDRDLEDPFARFLD